MKTTTNIYPLRRVLEMFTDPFGVNREHLECGHVVSVKRDIIGPTNANRRRCRKCFNKEPFDIPLGSTPWKIGHDEMVTIREKIKPHSNVILNARQANVLMEGYCRYEDLCK